MKKYPKYKDSGVAWIAEIPEGWELLPIYIVGEQSKNKNNGKSDNVLSLSYGRIIRRNVEDNFGLFPESFDTYQLVDVGSIILRLTDLQNDKKSLRVGLCKEVGIITSAYLCITPYTKRVQPELLYSFLHFADTKKVFYSMGGGVRQSIGYEDLKRILVPIPPLPEQQQIVSYLDHKTTLIDQIISGSEKKIELLQEKRTVTINHAVTKGLKPKVKMKDSGVEWIGEIPEGWAVRRINSLFKQRSETVSDKDFSPLSVTKNGILPQIEGVAKTENNDARKLVRKGDFVINSRSDRKGSSGTSRYDGSVSVINIVLEPHSIDPLYAEFLFKSNEFVEEYFRNGKGIVWDLWSTRYSEMKYILIPSPPIPEQQQIVSYLDEKTKEIDDLITSEKKRIELLKEYRQSLISEVVTGKIKVTS
jgi:type I restriction enzyme S subunit